MINSLTLEVVQNSYEAYNLLQEQECIRRGSIIVWRFGGSGLGLILDADYGYCKKISTVYGFYIAMRLWKIGIQTNSLRYFAYSVEPSTRLPLLSIRPLHSCNNTFIANCRFRQISSGFLLHLHEIAILRRIFIVLKKPYGCVL